MSKVVDPPSLQKPDDTLREQMKGLQLYRELILQKDLSITVIRRSIKFFPSTVGAKKVNISFAYNGGFPFVSVLFLFYYDAILHSIVFVPNSRFCSLFFRAQRKMQQEKKQQKSPKQSFNDS